MTFDHFDTHPQLEDTMHSPPPDNWESHFALLDDGTLDTVFVCSHCGEEVRTNPEPSSPNEPFDRIEEGGLIALEHLDDCPSGPGEVPDEDDDFDNDFDDDEDDPVDFIDIDDDEPDACCPMCSGPGVPLGALGHLFHWRCRNCGAQFSTGD